MRKSLSRGLVAAVVAIPLAACGSSGSTTASSGAPSSSVSGADVTVVASGLKYGASSYSAKAGDVRIELDNHDPVAHNVTLVNGNKLLVEADPKKQHTATVHLDAGTYQVYCSVPGHNMKATITVS